MGNLIDITVRLSVGVFYRFPCLVDNPSAFQFATEMIQCVPPETALVKALVAFCDSFNVDTKQPYVSPAAPAVP